MSITIGWWIVPLIITIAAFAWAAISARNEQSSYLEGMAAMLVYPIATIVSLVAWLFWSLFR